MSLFYNQISQKSIEIGKLPYFSKNAQEVYN
jgi:hypothetical protein